jgi:dienelactone hydrolase
MPPSIKKMICYSLSLLFFGCALLPSEEGMERRASLESQTCKADRLQLFRKPLFPLLASSEGDLHLVSQEGEGEAPRRSNRRSVIQPALGKPRNRITYTVQKLTYPSVEAGKEVDAYFYRPSGRRPFPVVVILPITNGDAITEHFARFFAEQQFGVLQYTTRGNFTEIIPPDQIGRQVIQHFKNYLHAYVVDILHGIDWLETQPAVHRSQIGLFGISQGAIVGSVVAGLDPRIQAGIFILGGGGLAGILSSTEEKSLAQIRKRIFSSGEFSKESFHREAAEAFFPVDPLTYADCIRPSTTLFVDARFDRVILPAYAEQLWKQMGKPPRIQIPAGHYTAGFFLPYIRATALRHFQSTLE